MNDVMERVAAMESLRCEQKLEKKPITHDLHRSSASRLCTSLL